MDCRKARYFLVASFDAPLDEESRTSLSYHLKDCRVCRHEAFYYRELFSAKEQLKDLNPREDFNERLFAEIRVREAKAAWPQPVVERPRRRWGLVLAPAVFAAAAAIGFVLSRPTTEEPAGLQAYQRTQVEATRLTRVEDHTGPAVQAVTPVSLRPRYANRALQSGHGTRPTLLFRFPAPSTSLQHVTDPFGAMVTSSRPPAWIMQPREQTRYVLPVVDQAGTRERIY